MVRTHTSMATPPAGETLRVLVAAVVAVALLGLPATAAAHDGFGDVADGGAHSADIHTLDHDGIFEGTLCGANRFCPGEPLTRAHMAVWLVRVLDDTDPAEVTETRFSDVAGDHPQAAFIERFAELGVTRGCASDPLRYCPDDHVTRAQMASFLVRAFDLTAGEAAGFADVDTAGVHSGDIDALAATRITFGCATGPLRYCPQDPVTRAQMASFLVRAQPVEPISAPLSRCTPRGTYGHGRVKIRVGTTGAWVEEWVAQGEANSCELIMAWWDAVRQAEADRIAGGYYPCEAPLDYTHSSDDWATGVPYRVGCWPLRSMPGDRLADPAAEADRLYWSPYTIPPNHPAFVKALYDCYRMALEGPPLGWTPPNKDAFWPRPGTCHGELQNFGNPVRNLGVDPVCAAEQFTGLIAEHRDGTYRTREYGGRLDYAGHHSWANCSTDATRALQQAGVSPTASFSERCEAVVDDSAAALAYWGEQPSEFYGATPEEAVATVKAMFCDGTEATLRSYTQFYGDSAADWLPPEGSPCWEKALLGAAWWALRGSGMNSPYC